MENIDLLTENKNLLRSTEHLSLQIAAVEEASGKKNEYCEKKNGKSNRFNSDSIGKANSCFSKGFSFCFAGTNDEMNRNENVLRLPEEIDRK